MKYDDCNYKIILLIIPLQ